MTYFVNAHSRCYRADGYKGAIIYICYLISAVNVFLVKELRNIHAFI